MINKTFIFLGGMIAGTYSLLAHDEQSIARLIMGFIMAIVMIVCGRVFSDAVDDLRRFYGKKNQTRAVTVRWIK